MDRYRRLGMEYRFHEDDRDAASLSDGSLPREVRAGSDDEPGAVADDERLTGNSGPDPI